MMLHCGARRIVLQNDPASCRSWRAEVEPDAVLVGEVDELPIEGFDLTNSPWMILQRGRPLFERSTVVHRTTSGVSGAIHALPRCDEVLLAAFVNARATAFDFALRAEARDGLIEATGISSLGSE